MAIYFTSDTHFGHANIIKLSKRPFSSAEEMDEVMISNWNEVVSEEDIIYHLGDFSYRAGKPIEHYLEQLNGEVRLVIGNHDDPSWRERTDLFTTVSDIEEITVEKKKQVVLCHYPMREWPGAWRGAWHLFGHVHSKLDHNPYGFSLDVGVDSHDYRPISVERIREIMSERVNPFDDRTTAQRF